MINGINSSKNRLTTSQQIPAVFSDTMTRMEAHSPKLALSADDNKNLEWLLEAFGSKVSLDDIASAYHQAGRNVYEAGELLCCMQGSSSSNSTPVSNYDLGSTSASSVDSSDTSVVKSYESSSVGPVSGTNGSSTSISETPKILSQPKPRNCPASVGTVSGVIGPGYARLRTSTREAHEMTKPVKLMSSEFPVSEIWEERESANPVKRDTMNKDLEKFLLRMLGNGFQLDLQMIREVVGGCGYDVRESMERLMNMSAPSLEMRDSVSSMAARTVIDKCPNLAPQHEEGLQSGDSARSFEARPVINSESEHLKRDNRSNLQKEVLHTLFKVPERSEEGPRKTLPRREERRPRTYGVVTGPLEDQIPELKAPIVKKEVNGDENEDTEDNYDALREAVMEYWMTMKSYYRAAADAYAKGKHAQADKLLEQGHFFMGKARETNEKSAKKLLQPRDNGETISIDIRDYEPKEAIRLLKTHLTFMCGIPSIHYLKVLVGDNDDSSKRKSHISKLLGRDSIPWTEEMNGQVIAIRVDGINPKRLSFKK